MYVCTFKFLCKVNISMNIHTHDVHTALHFSIKHKINHPPTDPDDQAIPKRFLELKRRMDKVKLGRAKKRPAKIHKDKDLIDTRKFRETEVNLPGMRRPEKAIPVFKQLPGEEGHQFVHRIQLKCQVKTLSCLHTTYICIGTKSLCNYQYTYLLLVFNHYLFKIGS